VEEVGERLAVNFSRIFECDRLLEAPALAAYEREN
jgi:hypothetical protein